MIQAVIKKCDLFFEIKFGVDWEKTVWWYAGAKHRKLCQNDCLFETIGVGHSLEEALKHRLGEYSKTKCDWVGADINNIKTILTQTNRLTFLFKSKKVIVKFNLPGQKIKIKATNLADALDYCAKIVRKKTRLFFYKHHIFQMEYIF
jgi:hypothetical protein